MSVQIKRIINPIGISYLLPYLEPGEEFESVEALSEGLKNLLMENYENTYFSMAIEGDSIVGFVLAYSPKVGKAVLLQSWVMANTGTLQDTLFMRVLLWAEQLDINELQLDTRRTDVECGTRWGFKPAYIVMTLDVPKNVESRLVSSLPSFVSKEEVKENV